MRWEVNRVVLFTESLTTAVLKRKVFFRWPVGVLATAVWLLATGGMAPCARGQSPGAVAGATFGLAVADGTHPFANSGYYLLMPGNAGNSYQIVNLLGTTNSGGSYSYAANGATGQLNLSDTLAGEMTAALLFGDTYYGTYTTTQTASGGQQHGDFILFNGQSPGSLAGKTLVCTINDGAEPFAASGTASLTLAASGNTYTITGDGAGVLDSSGTYSYVRANAATSKVLLTDSRTGDTTAWFAFSDDWSGSFGITLSSSGGYQVGDFQVLDTTPPTISITSPRNGQRWSNEVFTVTGHAGDNAGVAYVLYSLNGSDWLVATSTNDWNDWTSDIILEPGTNIVSACAVDNGGNASITNTVGLVYVVSAPLSLQTRGKGSIAPNYNNVRLQIGVNYTITASAAAGYSFANWLDDGGGIITNRPALTFNMQPRLALTANFADVARPTVAIAAPASGQRLSNSLFTVSGRATDNDLVAQVYYSLNNSDWAAAASGNNWANWTASPELVPGNNRLRAYAVDASGNVSLTNSVDFTYVLSAPLSVHTNGRGKIAPALNGSLLPIGQRFTLIATPLNGFSFTNWTDGDGNILTNRPVLSFVMASNLAITANFIDAAKPTLSISKKQTGISTTSEFITIGGRAADNDAVAGVLFSINGGNWNEATTLNHWADWTIILDLVPGTNVLSAYAIDNSGNLSATSTVRIIFTTAPASLSGFVAAVVPDGFRSFDLSFGPKNFGQFSADTNNVNGVGSYSYARLTPSTGRLKLNYTAPPLAANAGLQDFTLYFATPKSARFTNNTSAGSGDITFATTSSLTMTSLVKKAIYYVNGQGRGKSTFFNLGKYYVTNLLNGETYVGTTLAYTKFSPVTTLLKQTGSNGLIYTVARYLGTNYGTAYTERYGLDGTYLGSDTGVFGFGSLRPGGTAPASLVNRSLAISANSGFFKLAFANDTFSQQSPAVDFENGVGSYAYELAGPNSGNLALLYAAPADLAGGTSSTLLNFFAPNLAYLINADSTVSAAVLSSSTNFTLASPVDKVLSATNAANGLVSQFQLLSDGTFTVNGDWAATGSHALNAYSPETDMVQLTFADGPFAGTYGWLQLNYGSTTGGSYKLSIFDGGNVLLDAQRGNFGQQ